ncbi:tetratricopeptide repeat protein [bacterium]|nr:tetratricopeptide repeat protein [bacterium]
MKPNNSEDVLHALMPYLPRSIIQEYLTTPKAEGSWGKWLEASLLYADVSGFTVMSETLAQQGKVGAEELTDVLNNYFTVMLDIIFQYGGDAILFGGDAVIALFNGHRHLMRTLRCALKMQETMRRFYRVETSQGSFRLQMSIGVSAGELLLINLGEKSRRFHYLIAGETVQTLAQAEASASAGQVVLSDGILKFIDRKKQVILSPLEEGFYVLNQLSARVSKAPAREVLPDIAPLEAVSALGPYLPPGILSRLEADPTFGGVEGEHRQVTTLFANFYGANEPNWKDEGTVQWLNLYLVKMQHCVSKYDGVIARIDFTQKGHRLIILFGAPQAQEDAELHAVQCALEMKEQISQIGQDSTEMPFAWLQRIGISTGNVFCGDVGSPRRKEYTVMGDAVNLAARLMSAAGDGKILVDEATYRKLQEQILFKVLPPLQLKGKSDLVPAFGVESQRTFEKQPLPKATTPLVSRDVELRLLKEKAGMALAGQGQFVTISGGIGIGKSRLVQALLEDVEQMGMMSVIGNCFSYTSGTPYFPWAEILKSLLGIRSSDEMPRQVRQLESGLEVIEDGLSRWGPVLGEGLNIPINENDLTQSLSPQLRQERFFDLTLQLLKAHAIQQPLIVIVEDAHFIDNISQELLTYIARNIIQSPVLLIVVYRPGLELSECESYEHYTAVELKELSEDTTSKLIQTLVPPDLLSDQLRALIIEKARGNPLFVEGVAQSMLESGHIQQDSMLGQSQLASGRSEFEVPDELNAMVLSRIDRLPERRRNMLRIAAVAGVAFFAATLRNISPYNWEYEELYSELSVLEDEAFLRLRQPSPVWEYLFWHALVQEVAYENLSFARRRELHAKVGADLENRFAENLETVYEQLAYHYFRSDERDKALEYCDKAGDKAKRLYANQAAIDYYTQAIELSSSPEHRASLYYRIGQVQLLIGNYDEAMSDFQRMQQLARRIDDRGMQGEAFHSLSTIYERKGDYAQAAQMAQEAIHIGRIQDNSLLTKALRALARFYQSQGDYETARDLYTESLQIARELSDKQSIANPLNNLGNIALDQGAYEEAKQLHTESLKIRRELGDKWGIVMSLNNLGIIALDQGAYSEAKQLFTESLKIARELGAKWGIASILNNLGIIALDQDTYSEARHLFTESLKIERELGNKQGIAGSLNNLGKIAQYQDSYDEAKQIFTESLRIKREIGDKSGIAGSLLNLGNIALKKRDYNEARQFLTESLQIYRELGDKPGIAESLYEFGQLAEAGENSAQSVLFLLHAARICDNIGAANSKDAVEVQKALAEIQNKISTEQLEKMKEQAEAMSLEQVIELALQTGGDLGDTALEG